MRLHVLLTVHCGPEALLAERTPVGLRAHVRGHVPGEAAVGGEGGAAHAAAEGLDSGVRLLMGLEDPRGDEATSAELALVGLLPCV